MRGRILFQKLKYIINTCVFICGLFPKRMQQCLFVTFRNTPGKFGIFLRYILIRNLAKKCGDNVCIKEGCFFYNYENLSFGSNVAINPMCYIEAAGGIEIGNEVAIAHASSLISTEHTYGNLELSIQSNPVHKIGIRIHDDVWIASGVRVLAGTCIESRSIIAAGAVTKGILSGKSIYGGIPAKKIKSI